MTKANKNTVAKKTRELNQQEMEATTGGAIILKPRSPGGNDLLPSTISVTTFATTTVSP